MRSLAASLPLLFAIASSAAPAQEPEESFVVATLVSVERTRGDCGVMLVGTAATYFVTEGPSALVEKQIVVIVPCIELSRTAFDRNAGDLDAFVPGQTHHLAITKRPTPRLDDSARLSHAPDVFYLRAASRKPL